LRNIWQDTFMSEAKTQDSGANELRATMTTAEAANVLGLSRATVIRLCDANEENPEVGIEHTWTSPGLGRTDVSGNSLRGHRKLFVDSVRAYGEATGVLTKPGS
jgi:hypothetical protein